MTRGRHSAQSRAISRNSVGLSFGQTVLSVECAHVSIAVLGPIDLHGCSYPSRGPPLATLPCTWRCTGKGRHTPSGPWRCGRIGLSPGHDPLDRLRRPARPASIAPVSSGFPAAGCSGFPTMSPPTWRSFRVWPRWRCRKPLPGSRLVRGPLLAGLRRSDWVVLDGTEATLESLVVHTALRAWRALMATDQPDRAEWALRRALLVSPYDERLFGRCSRRPQPREIGSLSAPPWRSSSPGPARPEEPSASRHGPRRNPPWSACSIPRRRRSIAIWPASGLRPEGAPQGCRVSSRHGAQLLGKISRPRRRHRRRRHLPRPDAGELVRRAGGHRPGRARIGGSGQVPLQPDGTGGPALHHDDLACRSGHRHLRNHAGSAAGLADVEHPRSDHHRSGSAR